MRPLRVAYLVGGLRPGGAERQMLALAERLPKDRFQVEFVLMAGLGEYASQAQRAGLGVRSLGPPGSAESRTLVRLARRLLKTGRYVREARAARYDVVDAWLYPADVLAALTRHLTRTSVVVAGRRNLGSFYASFGTLDLAVTRAAHRLTDMVVANSEAVASDTLAREHLDPARLRVIRNGVEAAPNLSPEERARLRQSLGATPGDLVIGCVANYKTIKRLDLLIEAFATLREHDRALRLVIVGEGPSRDELQRQIQGGGLDGRVRLHGSVLEPRPLYGAFDIAVQSSSSEGLPNALLEAGAGGLPIAATAAGGTGEIIIDGVTGLLVPVGDPAALAAAVQRLVDDPDLGSRLGERARDHVSTQFGMDRFVAEFASLYEELAARAHPVGR